jgi:hypothetical protein
LGAELGGLGACVGGVAFFFEKSNFFGAVDVLGWGAFGVGAFGGVAVLDGGAGPSEFLVPHFAQNLTVGARAERHLVHLRLALGCEGGRAVVGAEANLAPHEAQNLALGASELLHL